MLHIANKRGTAPVCSSADSYDIIPRFNDIFFDTMRDMVTDIYTYFFHNLNSQKIYAFRRFRASGEYINISAK